MYFGPLLGVAHLPFMAVAPSLSGKIAGYSMTIAFVIALVAVSQLDWRLRPLAGRAGEVTWGERFFVAGAIIGTSAGSILLYLGSDTTVYQETELWAVALALLAVVVGLDLLRQPSRKGAVWMVSLCFSVCMIRLVVGVGVLALALLIAVAHVLSQHRASLHSSLQRVLMTAGLQMEDPSQTSGGLLVAGVGVTLLLYAIVNEAKFHTAFGLPLRHQALVHDGLDPLYARYATTHSSFNALRFLPTTLTWYLRPDALAISRLFPFVNFPSRISVIGSTEFAGLNPSSSLSATMPVLSVFALIGIAGLAFPARLTTTASRAELIRRFRPIFLAAVVGCVGTLTYAGIANRHMADLYPALLIGAMLGGGIVVAWLSCRSRVLVVAVCILVLIGLLGSIWTNLGLGLINQRIGQASISDSARLDFARFRIDLFHSMYSGPVPQVTWGGPVPKNAPLGSLFVAGRCAALYQDHQRRWTALERTETAGHYRLVVTVPTTPSTKTLPILVSGSSPGSVDLIGIKVLPGGRYVARYLSEQYGRYFTGHNWTTSQVQHLASNGKLNLDVVIDASRHLEFRAAQITVNGRVLISQEVVVHHNAVQTVGSLPPSLLTDRLLRRTVAINFPGSIVASPVTAPVCRSLTK